MSGVRHTGQARKRRVGGRFESGSSRPKPHDVG